MRYLRRVNPPLPLAVFFEKDHDREDVEQHQSKILFSPHVQVKHAANPAGIEPLPAFQVLEAQQIAQQLPEGPAQP